MTDTGIFATSHRPGAEALLYAEACLKQGMGYQAAAIAARINEADLRAHLPGFRPPARDLPEASPASPVAKCTAILATASAAEMRRIGIIAFEMLSNMKSAAPRDQTRAIIDGIAFEHGLTRADIMGPSRLQRIAHARQHAYWAVKTKTGLSLPAIGRLFGRDHSTVLYGIAAHEARVAQ